MTNIGCPIPCESATLLIFDRLFTRIGTNDILEMNESSLYFELNQAYNIFLNVVDKANQIKYRTLIISDGFAKSTNTDEGFSITFSFIERILLSNNVNLVLTANDVQYLAIAIIYRFISCIQMKSDHSNGKINHHYKAEKISPDLFSMDFVKDIELVNMPRDFRVHFDSLLKVISKNNLLLAKIGELEEKYMEKMKELLWSYSQITTKPLSPEEKAVELLNLKDLYFKDISSNK